MTRNQVAQMVLNALQSAVVEPDGNTTTFLNPDGTVLATTGKVNYVSVTSNQSYAQAISDLQATSIGSTNSGYIVELGEQLYSGRLRLDDEERDVFGRPARQWDLDGEEIGTYVKKELLRKSYTVKVEGGDVYSDIGATAAEKYPFTYWVNGVQLSAADAAAERAKFVRRNDDKVKTTGKGVLTEAYVDTTKDDEELTIVEIHTYLAYANNDYDERNDKLSVNIYEDLEGVGSTGKASEVILTRSLSGDDFDIASYKQDDLMLVTYAGVKKEVQSIAAPQVVADVYINSYSTGTNDDDDKAYMMDSVTADGTKYDASADAVWDPEYLYNYDTMSGNLQMKDHRYNLYLDQYGYVIGLENVKAATNYAFLVGYQPESNVLAQTVDRALVILIDEETGTATMKTTPAQIKDLSEDDKKQLFGSGLSNFEEGAVNKWVTYSMDGDVMVIDSAVDTQYVDDYTANQVIDKDYVTLEGSLLAAQDNNYSGDNQIKYGNTSTVYVAVDADTSVVSDGGSIVEINGTSVGVRNTNIDMKAGTTNASGAYVLYESGSGYIKYAVVVGENTGSQTFVYLTKLIKQADRDDEKDKDVFIYEGFVNGEFRDNIESLVSWEGPSKGGSNLVEGKVYEAKVNSDGRITRMTGMSDNWEDATHIDNRTDGYVQATSGTATNLVTLDADTKLWLEDQILYIHTYNTNTRYVQLDDNVKFWIRGADENQKLDGSYTQYSNAKSALNRLGAQQPDDSYLFTGNLVAICDPATGFATAIIIKDTKFEALNVSPDPFVLTYGSAPANVSGLKVTKNAGGAAIAAGDEVVANTVVKVEATVATGFTATVKVNNDSVGTISGTNSVTFAMPSKDSTITIEVVDNSLVPAANLKYVLKRDNSVGSSGDPFVVKVNQSGSGTLSNSQMINDVAKELGITNQSDVVVADDGTKVTFTVRNGFAPEYYELTFASAAVASWKGTIDGNTVFVDKSNADLDDIKTAESLRGTYVLQNAATGLNITSGSVSQDGKTYLPLSDTVAINGDGFNLSAGFVAVSGDGISGSKIIPTNVAYTVPAAADLTSAKGTGFTYASGAKYVVYGGSIPAGDLTDDIVLDQDYVKVTFALDTAVTTAGWAIDTTEITNTKYVEASTSMTVSVKVTKAAHGLADAKGSTATVTPADQSLTAAIDATNTTSDTGSATLKFTITATAPTKDIVVTITEVAAQ
ncbi:hypothetical protein AALA83_16810, partial [Oscillospiraceae bacterium 44-5]